MAATRLFLTLAAASAASAAPPPPSPAHPPAPRSRAAREAAAAAADVVWADALDLALLGQPFPSLGGADAFTRLPPSAEPLVPQWVWFWSRAASGIVVAFESNATSIFLNYTLLNANTSSFSNFAPIGMSGCDLYRGPSGDAGGSMRWVASTFEGLGDVKADGIVLEAPLFAESAGWPVGPLPAAPSQPTTYAYRLNLPSYNGVISMQVGVPRGASLAKPPAPQQPPRPVIVYGTSITQGGVTGRPGQKWTSRLSLLLGGTPVVNLGVCGACGMEPSVGAFVANASLETDAALIVVDCAWNMDPAEIAVRAIPLVLQLRAANPRAAIMLLEPTPYMPAWALGDSVFNNSGRALELQAAYQALLAQGVNDLFYMPGADLYGAHGSAATIDPTFEGTHPHDHGHSLIAQALLPVVQGILAAPPRAGRSTLQLRAATANAAAGAAAAAAAAAAASLPAPAVRLPEEQRDAVTPFLAPLPAPASTAWVPAASLALRGRAFNDTPTPFNRLPSSAHGVVRDAVWSLSLNSPGLVVGFATNSSSIYVDYTSQDGFRPMVHFPVSGVSGLELFALDEAAGIYRLVQPLQLSFGVNRFTGAVASGILPLAGRSRKFKLYLPLYNNPTALNIGVDAGSVLVPNEPFTHTAAPVVWYGTSIAQGGVSFKAANAFTNVIANALDTVVFNQGFSGNCKLEVSVAQFLTTIANPGAILIDCMRNEDAAGVNESAVPLVQFFRRLHPTTPIVLVEGTGFGRDWTVPESAADSNATNAALRVAYNTLVAAGDANLLYVSAGELWPASLDSPCANGLHPTDEGMVRVAEFFTPFLRNLLGSGGARA
jgi:lysophospholipase L1-like esterase